jgi:transcriptional regulator with XRE-family HTH domain
MHPVQPEPYAKILAANVRAARARLGIKQENLAARMTALGWRWYRQTASEVEAGKRRLVAEEMLGLAIALETTVDVLTLPPPGTALVSFGDHVVPARRLLSVIDNSVSWDGDDLKIT